jgi:hypothetical protein
MRGISVKQEGNMSVGLAAFTLVHVAISLIGNFSGFVVVFGMLGAKRMDGWTALFLTTTVLTSVTGFLFPFHIFCLRTAWALFR